MESSPTLSIDDISFEPPSEAPVAARTDQIAALDAIELAVREELAGDEGTSSRAEVAPMSREELRDVVDLSLWCGQLLLQNGASTELVERTVHQVGASLGCDWLDVLVSPNALIATTAAGVEFRTKVRRVLHFGGVNMDLVAELISLKDRAQRLALDRVEMRRQLQRIDSKPRNYNRWVVVLVVGLACAAFSRLLGGDWIAFPITLLASSAAMLVRQELARHHFNPLLNVIATAFVAGSLASLAVQLQLGSHPELVLAASVLLLVPGVPLINACDDLVQGNLLAGTARGLGGMITSLGIAIGLGLAIVLTGLPDLWHEFAPPQSLLADAWWSGIAAGGFAVLLNVPKRALPICMACGAIGHLIRTVFIMGGHGDFASIEVATFMAAVTLGFIARVLGSRTSLPASIYAIPAMIPMVPGVFAFGTMIYLLKIAGLLEGVHVPVDPGESLERIAIEFALKTSLICAALAVGIKAPALLFDRRTSVV